MSASTRNKHFNSNANISSASASAKTAGGMPDIDITKEELERISGALKNAEFRKLFLEYCEEIQDPENRKRYEEEIIQLEAERGVEVRFINPQPGFVIKTSVDGAKKCFVNVAKSDVVAKPSNEACLNPETGKRGLNWSIPLAQALPRDDLDAQGQRCVVYDVIFHPDALYLAERNQTFRKCLVDTALDAVEREFKVNLDRANLKYPKLQYKGVARPTVIRKLAQNAAELAADPHPLDSIYPAMPTVESSQPKVLPPHVTDTVKPEFTTPTYIIKHRRNVDMAEYTDELDAKLMMTMPVELVVEIALPLLNSTAECQLDVTERTLYLLSERPGAKYRLNLTLPYAVDDKTGNARFDTDTRKLCITLPVLGQNTDKQRSMHDTLLHLNREDSGVESDVRDEINSNGGDSPGEDLSDTIEEITATEAKLDETEVTDTVNTNFLKNSIEYRFPTKFDCNVLDNEMSLVLHVRNVQSDSIALLQQPNSVHLQFSSLGTGFYPAYYAFYLELLPVTKLQITSAEAEAWENNIVLSLHFNDNIEELHSYMVGLDANDLKEYNLQDTHALHDIGMKAVGNDLDVSVHRSEDNRTIEISIKPEKHELSAGTSSHTEDEDVTNEVDGKKVNQSNKKPKRKNKKRRSLSESACDDIKAYQQHQQQQEQEKQQQKQQQQQQQQRQKLVTIEAHADDEQDGDDDDDDDSSPERSEFTKSIGSMSVAVPGTKGGSNRQQQQQQKQFQFPPSQRIKQRSYSECRSDSVVSSSAGGSVPSFKGILKRYSRYGPRPSISDSCSSIDDCSSSYSCSVEDGGVVGSALRFSKSFSDIPEENVAGLSESCKKTVRFNEVIKKQVFRLDSSILGQKKKNQKRRDRKQRALQRRLSEGDSADYEDSKPDDLTLNGQSTMNAANKHEQHDSGLDLTNCNGSIVGGHQMNSKSQHKNVNKSNKTRPRLESESSSDVEANKSIMMFEMDM